MRSTELSLHDLYAGRAVKKRGLKGYETAVGADDVEVRRDQGHL